MCHILTTTEPATEANRTAVATVSKLNFMKWVLSAFLCAFSWFAGKCQVQPADGSVLNYRLVGFCGGSIGTHSGKYKLEIARGHCANEVDFRKNIIKTVTAKSDNTITEVPFFGQEYTWQISDGKPGKNSKLHYFKTGTIKELDTSATRIRVAIQATKFKNDFFFIDGTRMLYDMAGHPVWYLPGIKGISDDDLVNLRDLKITNAGTITFLLFEDAYEVNFNGAILWRSPHKGIVSGDTTEHVHHDFTRLNNGHYMVLGKEYIYWPVAANTDTVKYRFANIKWDSVHQRLAQKFEMGTVIEYDSAGNVVWSWKSSQYFMHQAPVVGGVQRRIDLVDPHENSMQFDEASGNIYLGFRNVSRVLRVHYPDGAVTGVYRNTYRPADMQMGNTLFCNQHAARVTAEGELYLFNNNLCLFGAPPRIEVLRMPDTGKGDLQKIWEFDCPIIQPVQKGPLQFVAGGNVLEMPDRSIFCSLYGDLYSNIFIIGRDKKMTWSVYPEKWNSDAKRWEGIDMYRASIVNDAKALERLVWNTQKAK